MSQTTTIQDAATLEETTELMKERLKGVIPEFEVALKAELAYEINRLKREKNAVILGHNYMEPALYASVPDHTGDSLGLSRISAKTNADVIVFCGVRFMAETAKILSPEKMVLIPSPKAGCSLAAGIEAGDIRALRAEYPGAPVVTYVNTYAEVKAESDYCCTSGNAAAVIQRLMDQGHDHIIFLPDEYLARNTAKEMGLPFVLPELAGGGGGPLPNKALIGWNAKCEVHEQYTVNDVEGIRKQRPDTVILAHPECSPDVLSEVDVAGSTKQMIDYIRDVDAPSYTLLTECAMGDNIAAEFPHREMVRMCSIRCPHMNEITLEDTLQALRNDQYQIELDPQLMDRARGAIDRMLAIG